MDAQLSTSAVAHEAKQYILEHLKAAEAIQQFATATMLGKRAPLDAVKLQLQANQDSLDELEALVARKAAAQRFLAGQAQLNMVMQDLAAGTAAALTDNAIAAAYEAQIGRMLALDLEFPAMQRQVDDLLSEKSSLSATMDRLYHESALAADEYGAQRERIQRLNRVLDAWVEHLMLAGDHAAFREAVTSLLAQEM